MDSDVCQVRRQLLEALPNERSFIVNHLLSESSAGDDTPPIFDESIGGALLDAARINVMAAMQAFPAANVQLIVLPGEEEGPPTLAECLAQAMQWLDAARAMTVQQGPTPTSIHIVESGVQKP
jgi:hypothetical protein